jgi:hypothetical protein
MEYQMSTTRFRAAVYAEWRNDEFDLPRMAMAEATS